MVIYVDIDETICKTQGTNYATAVPINGNISIINKLYKEGNEIIYWTARGTKSGIDWRETTLEQLKNWGALHSELKFGKPAYDLLICDKSINSLEFFQIKSI
jgi:dTDP-glucose 4,6-dehydratase